MSRPQTPRRAPAPRDVPELMRRAEMLRGQTLGFVATALRMPIPDDLRRAKGWVGQVIENILGASAGNQSIPDFPELGVELKTVPMKANGRPAETTYVCTLHPDDLDAAWSDCRLLHKLSHVLWVPYTSTRLCAPRDAVIGAPRLWSPNHEDLRKLEQDWSEHMEAVRAGFHETLTARHGEVLQVRPKAANARVEGSSLSDAGMAMKAQPRGFYLRTAFTQSILRPIGPGDLTTHPVKPPKAATNETGEEPERPSEASETSPVQED